MSIFTIDTSVVLAVILNESSKDVLLDLTEGMELQSAPTLPWEVGNALSALFKRRSLDLGQAVQALKYFGRIPIRLAEVELASAVRLAERYGIYAYDAYVLECAVRYRTALLTLDHAQGQVGRELGLEVVEA